MRLDCKLEDKGVCKFLCKYSMVFYCNGYWFYSFWWRWIMLWINSFKVCIIVIFFWFGFIKISMYLLFYSDEGVEKFEYMEIKWGGVLEDNFYFYNFLWNFFFVGNF